MSAPAIEARGLCVDRAGKPVLRDVAFEIRRGESVCIIGPNGAGKTTLLKSVGALVSPSAGRIRIDLNGAWSLEEALDRLIHGEAGAT